MTAKYIDNMEYFTQRDNKFSPSVACFPTSAAMAMEYVNGHIVTPDNMQLEDLIVRECLNLSKAEKNTLTSENGSWIWNHRPFQVIPIMAYVCNKVAPVIKQSWSISFDAIKLSIDNNKPVVCLGNFKSISSIGGHYNTIIGYNDETNHVFTMDPWGNGYENYAIKDGSNMYYDWSIFKQSDDNSYGLIFE